MKKIFPIFILVTISSCHLLSYKQKPDDRFNLILNSTPDYDHKLLYHGLYSVVKIDSLSTTIDSLSNKDSVFIDPIMFYGNGIVDYIGKFYSTNFEKRINYIDQKNKFKNLPFGVFRVNDDSVEASIYIVFEGNSNSFNIWYLCNFTGMVSGDSITNWRMIPPYPNFTDLEKRQKFNQEKFNYLLQPKAFIFQPFIQKTFLDSNNVWLNKYR